MAPDRGGEWPRASTCGDDPLSSGAGTSTKFAALFKRPHVGDVAVVVGANDPVEPALAVVRRIGRAAVLVVTDGASSRELPVRVCADASEPAVLLASTLELSFGNGRAIVARSGGTRELPGYLLADGSGALARAISDAALGAPNPRVRVWLGPTDTAAMLATAVDAIASSHADLIELDTGHHDYVLVDGYIRGDRSLDKALGTALQSQRVSLLDCFDRALFADPTLVMGSMKLSIEVRGGHGAVTSIEPRPDEPTATCISHALEAMTLPAVRGDRASFSFEVSQTSNDARMRPGEGGPHRRPR